MTVERTHAGRQRRLTPDREARIRKATAGADPRGSLLPAWMIQSLLAEVDALRTGQ